MEINYDIHTLHNVDGKGAQRHYVKLVQHDPKDEDGLAESIEYGCSLTRGDVKAALVALHDYTVRELSEGLRVHVPGLGYFSLAVELDDDAAQPGRKVRGQDIRLRGVNFRPERRLVEEIAGQVSFVRSRRSPESATWTEEELWQKLSDHLDGSRFVTSRTMQHDFGLSRYAANKWLALFVDKGLLLKGGTNHSPVYCKA